MLKNICFHIEQQEERQLALEQQLAEHITHTQNKNINAFQRHIPSILDFLQVGHNPNISLICNKFGKVNVVDYGLGRVLYGADPELEIDRQVAHFLTHAPYVSLTEEGEKKSPPGHSLSYKKAGLSENISAKNPLPTEIETLIVLGLGLGSHLPKLLQQVKVQHLVIYEPEEQYFRCSAMATDWKDILESAKQKGTALYFQINKDGRDILSDIKELQTHFAIKGFFLYQHYHHPVFDSIFEAFLHGSWSTVSKQGIRFKMDVASHDYCPPWMPPTDLEKGEVPSADDPMLVKNLASFEKYFPDIYREFEDYTPVSWLPFRNADGEVNLVNMRNGACWYAGSPKGEGEEGFKGFSETPSKDGLELGYKGEKLAHYLHYKFVKQTEDILNDLDEEKARLPQHIKSLILFGLASGYQLESLMDGHEVENLFICEPNRDFFFASLFAIDWASILERLDKDDSRVYINIGDDGNNLFRDLLGQFYAIGPYVLSHTFFYQSYYNSSLNSAIAQLREQLQIVISMGEYFDHAFYGINHTKAGLERGYPALRKDPAQYLSYEEKETPVYLVGNGPSLDSAIELLKEIQGKAIIVSCGTTLQVLHRNGIVPNYHAEIEQNRSTFDWTAKIGDFDYLKKISLISCNGIHPDTCELFKDTCIAFKEGESSTVSTLNVLGEENYDVLQFAFPTVTNFALNLFLKLGFGQIYLIGVDLGFVDNTKHHSVQSGYYQEDGEEVYDYREKNNTSLVVPGNFRATVFTKQEFKIATMIMEQSLASARVECYNTSDGARIRGCIPLNIENVLLSEPVVPIATLQQTLQSKCFTAPPKTDFARQYEEHFNQEVLNKELVMLDKLLQQDQTSVEEAERLIEKQKTLLFSSYQHGKSLLFYYLYGTSNFANALMLKCLYSTQNQAQALASFEQAKSKWRFWLNKIKHAVLNETNAYDFSYSLAAGRLGPCIKDALNATGVSLVTDSTKMVASAHEVAKMFDVPIDLNLSQSVAGDKPSLLEPEHLILHGEVCDSAYRAELAKLCAERSSQQSKTTVMVSSREQADALALDSSVTFIVVPVGMGEREDCPVQCNEFMALQLAFLFFTTEVNLRYVMPKVTYSVGMDYACEQQARNFDGLYLYDGVMGVAACEHKIPNRNRVTANGTRLFPVDVDNSDSALLGATVEWQDHVKLRQNVLTRYPFLEGKDKKYVQ